MASYEVAQRLIAIATSYDVRVLGEDTASLLVTGEFSSTHPLFTLSSPAHGAQAIAILEGNVGKTTYTMRSGDRDLGRIEFPVVAFKKTLRLTAHGRTLRADGGFFRGVFRCEDDAGKAPFEVIKGTGFRDAFVVAIREDEEAWLSIALLTAVAIHSRFFEVV